MLKIGPSTFLEDEEDEDGQLILKSRYKTWYKKLYLKLAFNFNISNISHQGYFMNKQSERLHTSINI